MKAATRRKTFLEELDEPVLTLAPACLPTCSSAHVPNGRQERPQDDLAARLAALQQRAEKLRELLKLECRVEKLEQKLRVRTDGQAGDQLRRIVDCITAQYGLRESQLVAKNNEARIVWPRHLICYFARRFTGATTTQIGRALARDHASVLNSVHAVKNRIETEAAFRPEVEALEAKIRKQLETPEPEK